MENRATTSTAIESLDRTQQLLRSSFVRYVSHTGRFDGEAMDVLRDIADDQTAMADRLADLLREFGAMPGPGAYPMAFTDSHDLALSYVLARAVLRQREDCEAVRAEAQRPGVARAARMLLEEAHGMSRGHLLLLEDLTAATNRDD